MKRVTLLALLGLLTEPGKGMKLKEQFIEEAASAGGDEAKTWLEVSKSVRNGEDLDGFTEDIT